MSPVSSRRALLSRDLLGDGALALRVDPALEPALERWAWPLEGLAPAVAPARALIQVRKGDARAAAVPSTAPTLPARHLDAWGDAAAGTVVMAGPEAGGAGQPRLRVAG
ncbi:MAG: hypothetical protein KY467_17380, partial [Gemmatimonadetes bacterium]|nr:hypothetical protein [Gemmatimonadota bacterium]